MTVAPPQPGDTRSPDTRIPDMHGTRSAAAKPDIQAAKQALSGLSGDLKLLVKQEVELAKAEIAGEAGKAGKAMGMIAGAGFAAIMIVIFLSTALWWALANVMDQSWAALIVAGVWSVIAAVLFIVGRGLLKSLSLTPSRTLASLKQIPAAFKPEGDLK